MLYLVDLEYIETRYTSQWKKWIPEELEKAGIEFEVISGTDKEDYQTTPGGFFNFVETQKYKAEQIYKIAEKVDNLKPGDIFLFTDAWHPGVIQLRQVINILKLDVKIFGMFHAGAYDPTDILGQTCRKEFLDFEKSLVKSLDKAFFATNFSKKVLLDNLGIYEEEHKCYVTGFPYKFDHLKRIPFSQKKNQILFAARLSPEKHPEKFEELKSRLPGYEYIYTLKTTKNRNEYNHLLTESKFTISFADHENWGIAVFESLYSGCIPIVPNRLSYAEMYSDELKYNSEDEIIDKIKYFESLSDNQIEEIIQKNLENLKKYCTFDNIINHIKQGGK